MRQPLQSEPPQIGYISLARQQCPVWYPRSVSTRQRSTCCRLAARGRDIGPSKIARPAEEGLAVFMKAFVNESRTASGEPLVYP